VNIIPSIHSVYWWNNQINHDNEVLMLIKTEKSRIPDVEKTVKMLHSYETPELIAIPIVYGLDAYLKWIDQATTKGETSK